MLARTRTHTHIYTHKEGNINQKLIMHTYLWIYCQPVPDHKPVQFSVLFQSVNMNMDQWREGETVRKHRAGGDEMRRKVGEGRWREWTNRSIFLDVTCSVFEAWWRKWVNVGKWEIEGRRGGRRRGENIWHRGEGERVSHWKMQRGGEGTKQGKEIKKEGENIESWTYFDLIKKCKKICLRKTWAGCVEMCIVTFLHGLHFKHFSFNIPDIWIPTSPVWHSSLSIHLLICQLQQHSWHVCKYCPSKPANMKQ